MPALVSEPSIAINGPGGRYNVSNPLYEYAFHPQPSAAEFPPRDYVSAWAFNISSDMVTISVFFLPFYS